MKKTLLAIASAVLFLFSCCEKEGIQIRVVNNYAHTINALKIGAVDFGNVATKITTDYQPIEEGSHSISGTSDDGKTLSGSVSVAGQGYATVTISEAGVVSLSTSTKK